MSKAKQNNWIWINLLPFRQTLRTSLESHKNCGICFNFQQLPLITIRRNTPKCGFKSLRTAVTENQLPPSHPFLGFAKEKSNKFCNSLRITFATYLLVGTYCFKGELVSLEKNSKC